MPAAQGDWLSIAASVTEAMHVEEEVPCISATLAKLIRELHFQEDHPAVEGVVRLQSAPSSSPAS